MKKIYRDTFFVVFSLFIIGVIIAANRGTLGSSFTLAYQIPHYDKIGHFVLMGILAFLAIISLVPRMRGTQQNSTVKVGGILLIIIALEEASQYFIPNRTFSIADYLCGVAGVLLAGFLSKWLPLKKRAVEIDTPIPTTRC